ncbi:hypothetical protein C8J57DRAFT_1241018 [Mycena rebaudengoi]|nr:hypothetical protein C8J57DRAFT_1241018 [Mycena rebaudengoi]
MNLDLRRRDKQRSVWVARRVRADIKLQLLHGELRGPRDTHRALFNLPICRRAAPALAVRGVRVQVRALRVRRGCGTPPPPHPPAAAVGVPPNQHHAHHEHHANDDHQQNQQNQHPNSSQRGGQGQGQGQNSGQVAQRSRPRWHAMLLEAGGLSAALGAESMRRLREGAEWACEGCRARGAAASRVRRFPLIRMHACTGSGAEAGVHELLLSGVQWCASTVLHPTPRLAAQTLL